VARWIVVVVDRSHAPAIKYLIIDVPCDCLVVQRLSRISNTFNSHDLISTCTSTRKRSHSPLCPDQCHSVKCLILNVDNDDIKDWENYENYTIHYNPSTAVEYEQFFIFFSGDEEDCRIYTTSCYGILVYVCAVARKHSSELIKFSVTQVFFFFFHTQ
jgi:hypothetical protein